MQLKENSVMGLSSLRWVVYQRTHLSLGFMKEPMGQENAFAKSAELERVPITLQYTNKKKV